VITPPTANTVHEALQMIDAFDGKVEDFQLAIAEEVFDPAGVNLAVIEKRAHARGWELSDFTPILHFRLYRFKLIGSPSQQALQRIAALAAQRRSAQRWAS
jgi:hypothetical protein